MSFHNHAFDRGEAKDSSTSNNDEANFLKVSESTSNQGKPGVSRSRCTAKDFDSKLSLFQEIRQEVFVQMGNILANTSMEHFPREDSEEEFNIWPKLRGGSPVVDKEHASDPVGKSLECQVNLDVPTTVSDNGKSFEAQHQDATEDYTSTESSYNILEELTLSCGNLFGNNCTVGITDMKQSIQSLKSDIELHTCEHIMDLPDLVLEHILGYIGLKDLSENVQLVCQTFHIISSRILRRAFKSVQIKLSSMLQQLETANISNWNPTCAEVLTCKLLQSEMDTLRAACLRQVESGKFCFVNGEAIKEYDEIINTVKNGQINTMLEGFSDRLVSINAESFKYWDARYDDKSRTLGDMKLFGIEIIELLMSCLNATGCVVITYKTSVGSTSISDDKQGEDASESILVAGCIIIKRSTQMKFPPTEDIPFKDQQRAILRFLRSLVRANNCDIVLNQLRAYSKETVPVPMLQRREWTLRKTKVLDHDMIQDTYKKEAVLDQTSTPLPECNMHLICSFEMVCPERVQPFGIPLNKHQSPLSPEVSKEDERRRILEEILSGEHYFFKMDIKTASEKCQNTLTVEDCVRENNNWFLKINSTSTCKDESTESTESNESNESLV